MMMQQLSQRVSDAISMGKKRKHRDLVEDVGDEDHSSNKRTLNMLRQRVAARSGTSNELTLITTQSRTTAPFERAPDTPRHGVVRNEQKQKQKPGSIGGFKPQNTLMKSQPGKHLSRNVPKPSTHNTGVSSVYFQPNRSQAMHATPSTREKSFFGNSLGRISSGASRNRGSRKSKHRRTSEDLWSVTDRSYGESSLGSPPELARQHLRHPISDGRQPEINPQSQAISLSEDASPVKVEASSLPTRGKESAHGPQQCTIDLQHEEREARRALTDGFQDITQESLAMKNRASREQRTEHLENNLRPAVKNSLLDPSDSEDELAGGTTIHSSRPKVRKDRKTVEYSSQTVPEWFEVPDRIPLRAVMSPGLNSMDPGLALVWDERRSAYAIDEGDNRPPREEDELIYLDGRSFTSATIADGDHGVARLHGKSEDDGMRSVWLHFYSTADAVLSLSRLWSGTSKLHSPNDNEEFLQRWNTNADAYKAYLHDMERSATHQRLSDSEYAEPRIYADPQRTRVMTSEVRNNERPKMREQMQTREHGRSIEHYGHSRTDVASLDSMRHKEAREAWHNTGYREEILTNDHESAARNAKRETDHDELGEVQVDGGRRKSARTSGISAGRHSRSKDQAPSPEPVEKWTKVHNPQPWKHPVVFPTQGPRQVTVDFADLERLDEGELLNDTLITFAIRRIEERMDPKFKVHFFNSYFFSALTSDKGKRGYSYDAVKRWTKSTDLLSKDFIVVPINHNLHWFAAILCNVAKLSGSQSSPVLIKDEMDEANDELKDLSLLEAGKHFLDDSDDNNEVETPKQTAKLKSRRQAPIKKYSVSDPVAISLDSFGYTRSTELSLLKDYLVDEAEDKRDLEISKNSIQGVTAKGLAEQTNFSDCGVFVVAYLEAFAKGPHRFIRKILTRELNFSTDYPEFSPYKLREELRNALLELYTQQEADRHAAAALKRQAKAAAAQSRLADQERAVGLGERH